VVDSLTKEKNRFKNLTPEAILLDNVTRFMSLIETYPEAFCFRGPCQIDNNINSDNPGCDLIIVGPQCGNRLIFAVEIKDQRFTNQIQWNDKIKTLATGAVINVLNQYKPNCFTFSIVLAGRNSSTFAPKAQEVIKKQEKRREKQRKEETQ
jgi:hypothetical protein